LATSGGTGAAAGDATRCRKSPTGAVRWKMIVFEFGVSIPEMWLSGVFALPVSPLITPT
jgi:hypothetical protein